MSNRQEGMALIEACLLGVVLGLMVMAGRWLMQQQYRLQQMQQSTYLALFSHDAQGRPVSVLNKPAQDVGPSRFCGVTHINRPGFAMGTSELAQWGLDSTVPCSYPLAPLADLFAYP